MIPLTSYYLIYYIYSIKWYQIKKVIEYKEKTRKTYYKNKYAYSIILYYICFKPFVHLIPLITSSLPVSKKNGLLPVTD